MGYSVSLSAVSYFGASPEIPKMVRNHGCLQGFWLSGVPEA